MKKKPKVLLIGNNYASVLNSLTIGFEEIGVPVKAVSLDFERSKYNNYSKVMAPLPNGHPDKFWQIFYKIKGFFVLIRYLFWCDVAHIYGYFNPATFWVISKIAKYKFITFLGSDIRDPEKELAINPYYKDAYFNEKYEGKAESPKDLTWLSHLKFKFIAWDMEMFLDRDIVGEVGIVPHASLNKEDIINIQKAQVNKKVSIVHSPTAPVAKGTEFIIAAIEKLKEKNIPFDFKVLQNLSNKEYQKILNEADIYVDQLIWGAYGVAAQQALQMGKVVVAYLTPERIKMYGEGMPIQNANIDNLAEVLEKLILDKSMREKISIQSVEYYKKMHKPERVAFKMLATYHALTKSRIK